MPIKKENKAKYPPDWEAVRLSILTRAQGRCEECGIPNHVIVTKKERRVVSQNEALRNGVHDYMRIDPVSRSILKRLHWTRVILTIAHLNHNPEDNAPANLKALCQLHHNRLDIEHRAETRKATIAANMGKAYPGWQQPLHLPEIFAEIERIDDELMAEVMRQPLSLTKQEDADEH